MRIRLSSIPVDDQERALAFYTDVLGFVKKTDMPAGEYRWITVVAADGPEELELALEPNSNPAAKVFQQAMLDQGIPMTAFESDDIDAESRQLKDRGVAFTMEPKDVGPVKMAIFADTCGNLIQIYQPTPSP